MCHTTLTFSWIEPFDSVIYQNFYHIGEYNIGGDPKTVANDLKEPQGGTPSMEIFCIKIGVENNAEAKIENEKKLRAISSEEKLNQAGNDPHFFRLKDFASFDILVQQIVSRSAGNASDPPTLPIDCGLFVATCYQ
jgi:hypothetical protein